MRPTHTPDGIQIKVWEETATVTRSPVRGRIGYPSDEITGWIYEPTEHTAEAYDDDGRTWKYVSIDGERWEPIECN
jgi:hypothetical protein